MRQLFKRAVISTIAVAVALIATGNTPAHAVPLLQLYIEGSTFDTNTETWVLESATGTFRLWAIGNVNGEGGMGPIYDVKLSAVYDSSLTPIISLVGTNSDGYNGFNDLSPAIDPTLIQTVDDGSSPLLGDLSSLPSHGQYGPGRTWQEFALGDMMLTDSQIEDFNGSSTPMASDSAAEGQINVYTVTVFGLSDGDVIHFDLYNHVVGGQDFKYKFAPFSHDGEGEPGAGGNPDDEIPGAMPEPSSIALLLMGAVGMIGFGYRRRKTTTAL